MVPKQLSSDLTALSDCRREFNDMATVFLSSSYDAVIGTDDDTVYATVSGGYSLLHCSYEEAASGDWLQIYQCNIRPELPRTR